MTMSIRMSLKQLQHGIVLEGYCRTECGTVPRDWTKFYLGDIYTERNEPGNENLPLLMVSIHSGVSDGEVDEEQLTKKFKRIEDKTLYKRAESGDLVFNMMRAWQGAVGTVRTRGMVSPAYIVAKPGDMVDPLFMNFYMRTDRMIKSIHRQSYGVTDFRLRLYWDSFAAIPCVLPPLPEQRKIAAILATQDKVIELYERKIEQLQLLKKNCLRKMFPRHGSDTPEIRFRGFTGTWERKRLGDLCHFSKGYGYSKSDLKPSGKPIILYGRLYTRHETEIVEVDTFAEANNESVYSRGGDVIVPASGETAEDISIASVVKQTGVIIGGDINIIEPESTLDSTFLAISISNAQPHADIARLAQGKSVVHLHCGDLAKVVLSYPCHSEQMKISTFFRHIDNIISLNQRKRDEEKQKKKALMQLLLTGIVRVGEAASCRLERAGNEAAGSRFSTRIAKV